MFDRKLNTKIIPKTTRAPNMPPSFTLHLRIFRFVPTRPNPMIAAIAIAMYNGRSFENPR